MRLGPPPARITLFALHINTGGPGAANHLTVLVLSPKPHLQQSQNLNPSMSELGAVGEVQDQISFNVTDLVEGALDFLNWIQLEHLLVARHRKTGGTENCLGTVFCAGRTRMARTSCSQARVCPAPTSRSPIAPACKMPLQGLSGYDLCRPFWLWNGMLATPVCSLTCIAYRARSTHAHLKLDLHWEMHRTYLDTKLKFKPQAVSRWAGVPVFERSMHGNAESAFDMTSSVVHMHAWQKQGPSRIIVQQQKRAWLHKWAALLNCEEHGFSFVSLHACSAGFRALTQSTVSGRLRGANASPTVAPWHMTCKVPADKLRTQNSHQRLAQQYQSKFLAGRCGSM